jgi:hypothetical protein
MKLGLKHIGSCLSDLMADVLVDDDARLVTLKMTHFDSVLVADLVTNELRDHGVDAFRDDTLGWVTPPAAYRLRIDIAGHVFDAQVVKLAFGGRTSVHMSLPSVEFATVLERESVKRHAQLGGIHGPKAAPRRRQGIQLDWVDHLRRGDAQLMYLLEPRS